MKSLLLLLALVLTTQVQAQNNPDVYLADITFEGSTFSISNLQNISNNPGYDNQPSFLADGSAVLYSGTRNEEIDIVLYDVKSNTKKWISSSDGGEYSPTLMPNGTHFSAINLKPDGEQLLWKFPLSGDNPEVIIPEEVIGYHAWMNESSLYTFVLGSPATFVEFTLGDRINRKVIATNPGRSIHKVPGKNEVSFVDKNDPTNWIIKTYNPETKSVVTITSTLKGSEDMFWTNDGGIILGSDSGIALWTPENGWSERVSIFKEEGTISRVSLSPDNTKIAIVFAKK